MGRGDRRTRKGKISAGSYGVVRKRTKATAKTAAKKPAAAKAPAKKPTAKK